MSALAAVERTGDCECADPADGQTDRAQIVGNTATGYSTCYGDISKIQKALVIRRR